MEQVHISRGLISRFTQKCILKGTKFHENCQNTDLYQQTVSELAILWNPGTSSRFQGELPQLSRSDLKSTHSPWVSEDENWHD